ncbi:MAG TPA: PEP/pyruvate-binding domain-containing protein [Bacteroidales bacterium]|nr:PEP/pyruvate-binding domain-containing protein [Bacteroidales bacterium]
MNDFPDDGNGYSSDIHYQHERMKELACINRVTQILKENKPVDDTLMNLVLELPTALQYPDYTVACIRYLGKTYETPGFAETEWKLIQGFETIMGEGSVEVCYTRSFVQEDEGPFMKEERDLLINFAGLITGYINSLEADTTPEQDLKQEIEVPQDPDSSTIRRLLQQFLDRHNAERDVFHDLMPFMVREILLVASLYDAYSIEGEGRFSDYMLGEYYQMSLTTIPRITGVSGEDEAFSRMEARHYDMIIIMVGVDKTKPLEICRKIKEKYPYIPTYILLNNPGDIPYVQDQKKLGVPFDNLFVWTGESRVFFAMAKLLEDKVNVRNDTRKGLTGVILIIEDAPDYYSTYVPMLYTLVLEQTRILIEDVSSDELYKVLKLRARPKILLATNWEEAISVYEKYRDRLLGVISDMRFPRNGELYDMAGYELISLVRQEQPRLPTLLQSSDPGNARFADELKASFINKNSESLLQDLKSFITYYLGFGHFVYRDTKGRQIAVAKSMKEFEAFLKTVPEDSLVYHAMKNHFSLWLMARGEVKIAKMINPVRVADFNSLREMREFLLDIIRKRRREMNKGKVVNFDESLMIDESNVVSFAGGSLGGKGRGLAFISTLIYSFELGRLLPGINIRTPLTVIIGTDEFDQFMDTNRLWELVNTEKDFPALQKQFLAGTISEELEHKLGVFIRLNNKPLAVRSSSLFEDSLSQPFSGIFGTYLLPNNHPDPEVRLMQLIGAIKLVFSSIYSDNSRIYFEAVNYKIEQEKMAVVIQAVVGNRYGDLFYPHISGTAQSFNFYPVANMTPHDGFAVAAVGLGQYVLDGEKAFRFSPAYPALDIVSINDLTRYSQTEFYAVNLARSEIDLLQGENAGLVKMGIARAESDGTLTHAASVYSIDDDTLNPGLTVPGPRVVNFANILKYDYIPLAHTLKTVLEVVREAFGAPVEIEYAVDLNKDEEGRATFYLLQIKPLVGSGAGYSIDPESVFTDDTILVSRKSMGNGLVEGITDIIYVEPDMFDNLKTAEMASEIDAINRKMLAGGRKYVLIGPGRWGTKDRFLGIPVDWPQISNARIIVEVSLPSFHVDASQGSHFFHNVTSMGIGYFAVNEATAEGVIMWDKLRKQKEIGKGHWFRHVRFPKPLVIRMDGRLGMAVISLDV